MRVPRVRFRIRTLMILVAVAALLMPILVEIVKASKSFDEFYFPRRAAVEPRQAQPQVPRLPAAHDSTESRAR